MGSIRIERFLLWRLKEKELLSIKSIFKQVADFFEQEQIDFELDENQSFKDGILLAAKNYQLICMPMPQGISEPCFDVPIIAREKNLDQAVVLIPYADGFIVKSQKPYYVKASEIFTLFDEHILIYKALEKTPHNHFVSNKTLIVLAVFSLLFFTASIFAVRFFAQFQLVYLVASLFFLCLSVLFYQMGQRLSGKDYGLLFGKIYYYLDALLSLPTEQMLQEIGKATQKINVLQTRVAHFLDRFSLIFFCAAVILSLLVGLWQPSLLPFMVGSWALMAVFFWRLRVQEAKYLPKAKKYQSDLEKTLEQYKTAFMTLSRLKTFGGFSDKLSRQRQGLFYFEQKLNIIKFLKKNAQVFGPLTFYLAFSLWRVLGVDLLLWQAGILSIMALLLGLISALALENLFQLPDADEPIMPKVLGTHVEPVNILGAYELINVSFSYPEAGVLIFKNYQLDLKEKGFYGIHGPSGSGKSTLLKILMGFLRPDGQVIIDGQDLRSLNLPSLRKHFGVILDDSALFMGSVYENILCGRDIKSKDLERLLLHPIFDTLLDMPMGLESFIFWHQKNLTHYEKALILLARSLVHRPQVLIMDEFINSLSHADQDRITDFLSEQDITRILVSNNPQVLAKTTAIYIAGNQEAIKIL